MVNATGGTFTCDGTPQAGGGTATGGAGESLAVTLSYSGSSYGPTATAPTALGSYEVTASTPGDSNNYPAGPSAPATLIIVLPKTTVFFFQ